MITIALYNLKGGVGKTTSAVNLAYLAAESKKNTVLWDWDPQGAASWYCGVDEGKTKALKIISKGVPVGSLRKATPYPRLTVVPADLSLRKADIELAGVDGARKLVQRLVAPLSEDASLVVFDCPPMISPSMEYLLSAVDLVLVPMIPSPLSLRAMEQVVSFFETKKRSPKQIYGFFNMVDRRRNVHKQTLLNAKALPLPIMNTVVPMDSAAEKMSHFRKPLTSYSRSGNAAQAYRAMWAEIKKILKNA
jgi:cellulose biosynthesis protein BcsQ